MEGAIEEEDEESVVADGGVKVAGVGLGVMDERAAAWWSGGGDGRERKMVMEIS